MDPTFWETLLVNVESQRVIPIVGPELLTVQQGGGEKLLHRHIAEFLAQERGISTENLSDTAPLNDLVWRSVEEKKLAQEVIYKRIKDLATDPALVVPESLKKLARIRHFNLFVSTTCDSLLERAINEVRAPQKAQVIAYLPNRVEDLPADYLKSDQPIIYQLLGRYSVSPEDYVVTDEDMLEFVYSLQEAKKKPSLLFDALRENNLLIIGSTFPDWLVRFFMRNARGQRLSGLREKMFLADRLAGFDPNLVVFLERFTNNTTRIFDKGATEFVDELWQRYAEAKLDKVQVKYAGAAIAQAETNEPPPSIFLSYTGEDIEIARGLCEFLEKIGWKVWFDKVDLEIGDNWNLKIVKNIHKCDLFLPLISRQTNKQKRAYFRKEWNLAIAEFQQTDTSVTYLLPIVIDETDIGDAKVPEEFKAAQFQKLPGGEITPKFEQSMERLLREQYKLRDGS